MTSIGKKQLKYDSEKTQSPAHTRNGAFFLDNKHVL